MEKSFSLFANFKQTTPSEITLDRVYRLITTDSDLRDRTEKFRFYLRVGNKQMSACEKTSCPAFTPACDAKEAGSACISRLIPV